MDDGVRWTLDELGARVSAALAVDYVPAASARVRAVPDARTIRYYTTLGLIDRPAEMRGRVAFYGSRHLLQLVAIKRLQGDGHTLAEVQARLTGLDDPALARLARVPDATTALAASVDRFSCPTEPAANAEGPEVARAAEAPPPRGPAARAADPTTARSAFWAAEPALPTPAPELASVEARALLEVRLAPGVTLVLDAASLEGAPDASDLTAVLRAAAPLLTALRERGLTATTED